MKNRSLNFINIMIPATLVVILLTLDERFQLFYNDAIILLSFDNIKMMYNLFPSVNSINEYMEIWEVRENTITNMDIVDISTGSRLYTYLLFIKTINITSLVFGNGPGFYGAALDSSILRLFGEVGLIGLYFGFAVINGISKSFPIKNSLFFLLILMSLSDIFYSAKFFIFLVMLSVYLKKKKEMNEKDSHNK